MDAILGHPTTGNTLYVARITGVECVSAISRRVRGGHLTAIAGTSTLRDLKTDLQHAYKGVDITTAVVDRAMQLAEMHGLRGYDAVQLATAVALNVAVTAGGEPPIMLISADTELNTAVAAEGLLFDDPNAHP